jgi:membrane protein YdbS with pleckstrin-like domain
MLRDVAARPLRNQPGVANTLPSAGVLAIHGTMEEDALTPLHPNYVKTMRIGWLIAVVPLLLVALVLEIRAVLPAGLIAVPVVFLAAYAVVRAPLRRYHARGYALGPDRLRVVRGLIFRSDTVVPFGRVQHIDVHQGPLERAYDLGTLVLHTAGNHNASVSLPGVAYADALAMRETIRRRIGHDMV